MTTSLSSGFSSSCSGAHAIPELLIGMTSPPVALICLPAKGRFYYHATARFLKSFLLRS